MFSEAKIVSDRFRSARDTLVRVTEACSADSCEVDAAFEEYIDALNVYGFHMDRMQSMVNVMSEEA